MKNRLGRKASKARSEWKELSVNDALSPKKRKELYEKAGRVYKKLAKQAVEEQETKDELRAAFRDCNV